MPDRVDAAMDPVQEATIEPVLNLVSTQPERQQLPPRDSAVLSRSQQSRFPVQCIIQCGYLPHSIVQSGHGAHGDTESVTSG